MFLKLLQKLIDEYAGAQSYMGGDLEADLDALVCGSFEGGMRAVPREREGYIRALYDLGVLVALEPPADGEVTVDAELARKILRIANGHRVGHLRACYECEKDVGPDAVRLGKLVGFMPNPTGGSNLAIHDVYAFCPDCAAAAGPEWVKP